MRLASVAVLCVASACTQHAIAPVDAGPPGGLTCGNNGIRRTTLGKLDLLVVVDDAPGMADVQASLAQQLPSLLGKLGTLAVTTPGGGSSRLQDVHVAFVSSSLGGHGTSACGGAHGDDHGQLLPRAGENGAQGFSIDAGGQVKSSACAAPVAASAIDWSYGASASTPFVGAAKLPDFELAASCVVTSLKADGCGYPAPLEAAYHFLVDPAPYLTADATCTPTASGDDCGSNSIVASGVDQRVLAERAAFLRPDSFLAVLFVGNHDDASLLPAGLNWFPLATARGAMPPGWAGCHSVPDDFEPQSKSDYATLKNTYSCQSCVQQGTDPGGGCVVPWGGNHVNADADALAVRMIQQTRRFGFNFLWGRQRYVDAFSAPQVPGSDGKLANNPIFAGGVRTQDLVLVAGILGVPKPLAPPLDASGQPRTLTEGEWQKIVSADAAVRDPHMIEQIAPRVGVAKFGGDPSIDPVNGGDRDVPLGDDLQYACVGDRASTTPSADCSAPNADQTNPLCAKDSSGAIVQPRFKAYPTLRQLRVLHELSQHGVQTAVASVCEGSYATALGAIAARIAGALSSQCFTSLLDADPTTGAVACAEYRIFASDHPDGATRCEQLGGGKPGLCTPGAAPCRTGGGASPLVAPDAAASAIQGCVTFADPATGAESREAIAATASDGNVYATGSDGVRRLVCEVLQLSGSAVVDASTQAGCLHDPSFALPSSLAGGYCYSTDASVVGRACLEAGSVGTIRMVGDAADAPGTASLLQCTNR